MLFWIFVGAFIIALVLVYLLRDTDILLDISAIIATVLGGVIVISLCIMACNYIGIDAEVAGYQKRYEALTYQYENDFYDNDNDVGKKELVSEIQCWNSGLAYRKTIQRDFWVGIYYPNVYDQFEFIELNKGMDYKVEDSQEDG